MNDLLGIGQAYNFKIRQIKVLKGAKKIHKCVESVKHLKPEESNKNPKSPVLTIK